jgi:nucleotide-binding universal stress UspA family protein
MAGHCAESRLDHVAKDHIDLIAMATHGCTGLTRLVMGSVAKYALWRTSVPMLLRAALPEEA